MLTENHRDASHLKILSIFRDLDDDFSNVLLAIHVLVRLPKMFEVEYFVDYRPQLDRTDETVHLFKSYQEQ